MDRRKFIISSSLTAIAIATFGHIKKTPEGIFVGDCDTTDDILGPKYRPGAPVRTDLIYSGLKGDHILIKGKIFANDCTTPLTGATIEFWHCNAEGDYDDTSPEFRHRAKWTTDTSGEYSFLTIIPGRYLNGRLYRPAHYHIRVTAKGYRELISQIYFKGDPHIAKDPWASKEKAKERILEVLPGKAHSEMIFNIYMEKI